jgi:tRNA-dihydrouridine synthase
MFDECVIRDARFVPARFCAPLAGYSHSAFRRLVAELGGCGALWTEMLAARQILNEDFSKSPWLKRRPVEGCVFYQLMINAGDPFEKIMDRLGEQGVHAVDLNLACNAPQIRACASGSALFEQPEAMEQAVIAIRANWPGILTAKIRLGSHRLGWQARFIERIHILENAGIDALILHTRFFEDRFRRSAHHHYFAWAKEQTRLPMIANGDMEGPAQAGLLHPGLQSASGIMIGRMAVVRPWIFAAWNSPFEPDYPAIWRRMSDYIIEDFDPVTALRRIQMFSKYFTANFAFGHHFNCSLGRAKNLDEIRQVADEFFSRSQPLISRPVVAGL